MEMIAMRRIRSWRSAWRDFTGTHNEYPVYVPTSLPSSSVSDSPLFLFIAVKSMSEDPSVRRNPDTFQVIYQYSNVVTGYEVPAIAL